MPFITICSGELALVDEEDFEFASLGSWHIYRIRPSRKPAAARTQTRYNRMFRLQLHREVALRMMPEIAMRKFRVKPRNGDYLDCRRENLDVLVQRPKRGTKPREPRSPGWQRKVPRIDRPHRNILPTSAAWTGGVVWRVVNKRKSGGHARFRLTIGADPID